MRNRNDAGNVHFDQTTSEYPIRVYLDTVIHGTRYKLELLIPLKIHETLNSADYDAAKALMIHQYDKHLGTLILQGLFGSRLTFGIEQLLKVDVCEFLYNEFTLHQHRLGNDVWATPRTMQDVGPAPEEDKKYEIAPGVLGIKGGRLQ